MPGELFKQFHRDTFKPQEVGQDVTIADIYGIRFKEYPRLESVELPAPQELAAGFSELLRTRRSIREFPKERVTFAELSTLLYFGAGMRGERDTDGNPTDPGRFYPSGGSRMPLEVYLLIKEASDLERGVYHYNVLRHALEKLDELKEAEWNDALLDVWSRNAPVSLIITAVWNRVTPKYKDLGYQLSLIEAGHLAQNFLLGGTALGLSSCPHVGFKKEKINELLDIHRDSAESALYMIALGK